MMLLQKDFHAHEPNDSDHICDVCSEAVTNPLCPFCLTIEIEAWLTLYPTLRRELLSKLNEYLNKTHNKITNYGTRCIKCKMQRAYVCPYCFTEFVFKELIEINAEKLVLREFFEFFNFDLDHKGYSKIAEEMGVL